MLIKDTKIESFHPISGLVNQKLLINFVNNHSKKLFFAIVILIIALFLVSSYVLFNSIMQNKYSEILHESMIEQQAGNLTKSRSLLKSIYEAKTSPSGVKSIAAFRYAALLNEDGKKNDALKIYIQLTSCSSCDKFVRNLSGFLAARAIATDRSKFSDQKVISEIEKIENSSEILRYHIARERGIIAYLNNDFAASYQIFEMIFKASDARESLKSNAEEWMQLISNQKQQKSYTK